MKRILQDFMKKILWISDAWSTSHLSHQPSKPAYYIVDWQIFAVSFLLRRIGGLSSERVNNLVSDGWKDWKLPSKWTVWCKKETIVFKAKHFITSLLVRIWFFLLEPRNGVTVSFVFCSKTLQHEVSLCFSIAWVKFV